MNEQPTVLGRELYDMLEVKTPYTQWLNRMCEYGFTEGTDYILVSQNCETNNPKNPHNRRHRLFHVEVSPKQRPPVKGMY